MKHIINALALTVLTLCASCDGKDLPDFMKSEGSRVTDTLILKPYKELVVSNNFNVELVKDTRDYVVVEYGENLIDNVGVHYDEASMCLRVTDDTKFGIVRNNQSFPKIKCHFSLLRNFLAHACVIVTSNDSVDVSRYTFDGFVGGLDVISNAPELALEVSDGSGSYNISGVADVIRIDAQYTSIVDARGLKARVAHVESNSTGDVYVNAADTVYASIHHTGDICYKAGAVPVLTEKKGKGGMYVVD